MSVQTVKGPIKSSSLGKTLVHEHLYVNPGDLREYYDYTFDDVEKSIEEVNDFKKHGGNTIVDLTPINYGRNPIALEEIANKTNINILFTTGFHKDEFLPRWVINMSEDEIYNLILSEINDGVSSHYLKPSVLKIGTSYNKITDNEKKIMRVCAQIQKDTSIPMITHCDDGTFGLQQLDYLVKNGADPKKICLSHVDLTLNVDYLCDICSKGAYISFDHLGRELENMDIARIQILSDLISKGFKHNICISGDMGRKKYFKSYGGKPGLSYILSDFKDYSKEIIKDQDYMGMILENPQRLLDWENASV